MSSTPTQIRTVDPFAEYNSNVANRLTRMVSGNANVLMSVNSLSLSLDTTSPTTVAVVRTGSVFKDDVLIQVTANHQVDFTDLDNYISPGAGFDEIGYYYVVLEYTYVKSRPAPEANIKILKPSQRATGYPSDSLVFLGAVKVINIGITQGIDVSDPFHNADPEDLDNRRIYVKSYAGTETGLPTHENFRDQSRIAYDSETDKFWLGYRNNWQEFGTGGSVINIDTTGTNVGQLCYVDATGAATPAGGAALLTSGEVGADIAVEAVGLEVDSSGKGLTSGIAVGVEIETAIVVAVGDLLYLSNSEAGKVTPNKTSPYYQVVGRALTAGTGGASTIDIIFTPKVVLAEAIVGQISSWDGPDGSGLYYKDINISALDIPSAAEVLLCNFFDNSTQMKIQPTEVEILSTTLVRIYMNINSVTLNYIFSTGGGGTIGAGGGGGSGADHSLLLNLDYASSGHTGFAPSPHDNTHHTNPYALLTEVTYNTLNSNGDVGTGATQVAQGNHTHGTSDIPSGTQMVFRQASAPTGWTIVTAGFNNNSMLVLGTSYVSSGGSQDARSFNPAVSAAANGGHSHTTGSHTLTLSQIPSHNHSTGGYGNFIVTSGATHGAAGDSYGTRSVTGSSGGGGSHNHGSTSTQSAHSHVMSYSSYAPYYTRLIAATKD